MKSTKLMLITILCLILSSLSGCKKDIVESLLKNKKIQHHEKDNDNHTIFAMYGNFMGTVFCSTASDYSGVTPSPIFPKISESPDNRI